MERISRLFSGEVSEPDSRKNNLDSRNALAISHEKLMDRSKSLTVENGVKA